MDPLSVSSACVGLIAGVSQLTLQISSFVSTVRDARKDMDAVSRELTSLSLCLQTLRDDSTNIEYPQGTKETLIAVIQNCDSVTKQMETLLKKMSSGSLARSAQWAMTGRDDMNKLRSSLEAHKAAIEIALDMISMYVFTFPLHLISFLFFYEYSLRSHLA